MMFERDPGQSRRMASVHPTEARSGEVVNEKNAPKTDALRFGLSSLNDRTH
jgi:hypothetical protein